MYKEEQRLKSNSKLRISDDNTAELIGYVTGKLKVLRLCDNKVLIREFGNMYWDGIGHQSYAHPTLRVYKLLSREEGVKAIFICSEELILSYDRKHRKVAEKNALEFYEKLK